MNCKQCRRLLESYQDGELAEAQAAKVHHHLSQCAACAGELEILQSEEALFERYRASQAEEASAATPRWEAVRQSLVRAASVPGGEDRFRLLRFLSASHWVRQAVYASLLVAVSIAGTLFIVRRERPAPPAGAESVVRRTPGTTVAVSSDVNNQGLESAMRAVRRAEQEYLQAIHLLNEVVDRRKATMDPRLVREIEGNLKLIDQSIAATRRAYYERPSDPELAQYMLAAYSKKVELLQELAT